MSEADPELPDIEFYTLPDLSDLAYWDAFMAAGLHQPAPEPTPNGSNRTYQWVNLGSPEYATAPDPPTIEGILYAGRRHVISGPPESAKTLVAYMLLLSALRAQEGVCILDFEMGPHAAATLLRELGAHDDELPHIHYTEPEGPPTDDDVDRIVRLGVGYVMIDAAAGAYDSTGLDDNSRKDAEHFAGQWIRPLWQAGIATIVLDHVTKDTQSRGKFTIGSERKTGQADVHLSLEALKPLHRGGTGMVKINVHKDRPGHLPRPTVYMVDLTSDPDTHHVTWELREPLPVEPGTGAFRHTIYMERVSREMEKNPTHAYSKNELEHGCKGKAELIREAVNELLADKYVVASQGTGGHLRYTLLRPFVPPSSHVRPDEGDPYLVPSSPPIGDETKDEDEGRPSSLVPRPELDIYDAGVQALLDGDDDLA